MTTALEEGIVGAAARGQETIRALASLVVSLVIISIFLLILGHNPVRVAQAIVGGALGSSFAIGQTAAVLTPLLFTALAAAIPFSARLWNIGGEGQLAMGAIVGVLVSLLIPVGGLFLVFLALIGGMVGGGLWGLIPAVLKNKFGVNEVIVTIMMNFIAILLVGVVVSGPLRGYSAQTVAIPEHARLAGFSGFPGLHVGLLLAIGAAVGAAIFMGRTRLGFEIRAVGLNATTARWNGLRTDRVALLAFVVGGSLAGVGGAIEVSAKSFALVQGFTANLGFLGIVAALVARLHPLAIVPSAAFFAVIIVGGNSLPATVGVDKALSVLLVGLFVLTLFTTHALSARSSARS